jgi:DUF2975 family protein
LHKTYSMRKRRVSILALAIAGVITTFLFILFKIVTAVSVGSIEDGGTSIDLPQGDTAFGGIFYTSRFNDSLPHYLYQHMEDSISKVKAEQEIENRGVSGDGMSVGLFGIYVMDRPEKHTHKEYLIKESLERLDNATIAANQRMAATTNKDSIEKIKNQLRDSLDYYKRFYGKRIAIAGKGKDQYYYIGIDGYRLDRESKFFIQNETYNLAYVKWDTARSNSNNNWKHGHYERKEIPVRYSAENERVFVPVTGHQYEALRSLFYVLWFVFLVGALYFFVGIPVQVLLNISRGLAFDENNVRYFRVIARLFFVSGLIYLFGPYILDLFLRMIVPADFKRAPFTEGLSTPLWLFVLSITVFITGKAFQKGNTMQKEQDLTI